MSAKSTKLKPNIGKLSFSDTNLRKSESKNNICEKYFNLGASTIIKTNDNQDLLIEFDSLQEDSILGSGEFGVVRKMSHISTKFPFAVKILDKELIETNENKNACLMDLEVSIKIGNGSPFLVRFYGALFVKSSIWILTEVMDTSLEKFYNKAYSLRMKLPEGLMAKIAYSVLNALVYLKKLKILHRDIKPSNILVNSTGEMKVCDFGISGFTTNSVCNTWKGCQPYMPPEKVRLTENGYNIKSDIWSLGISLIEISNGVHPYAFAKGPFELSTLILQNESPKLDIKKYSYEFCSFVDNCLIKEVSQRSDLTELLAHKFILKNSTALGQNELVLAIIKLVVDELKNNSKL